MEDRVWTEESMNRIEGDGGSFISQTGPPAFLGSLLGPSWVRLRGVYTVDYRYASVGHGLK